MPLSSRQSPPLVAHLHLGLLLILLITANLSIAVSQLALGLGLLLWVTRWLVWGERPLRTGLEQATFVLALWALAMIPLSSDPGQSAVFYRRFFLFSALWVTASQADSEARRRWLLMAVTAGAVLISLYSEIHVYRETGALFQVRLGEMSNPMTSGCLLMLVLLTLGGMILTPGTRRRTRIYLAVAALPIVVALVQTMTRSAWLGLVCGGLAMVFWARPKLTLPVLALALLLLVVLPQLPEHIVPGGLSQRLSLEYILQGDSTDARVDMWRGGWQMIKQHPILGVGDRDLTELSPTYYTSASGLYFGHMHSNLVQLAVIWGLPGFLAAMAFLVAIPCILIRRWLNWRRTRPEQSTWQAGWVLGALGAWVGFFVAGLTEWYFGDAESMLLFLTIVGAALGRNQIVNSETKPVLGVDHG